MPDPIAVITGGAVGIGQAIAKAVGERGGRIFNIDHDASGNEETDKLVADAGGHCTSFTANAGDPGAVREIFDQIESEVDHIDLLVNNSAIWNDSSLTGGDYHSQVKAFQTAIDSCLHAAFCCTMAAIPLLGKANNPVIINMNTEHMNEERYLSYIVGSTGYDCAKFGLWRLTQTWAAELKSSGIRVNELCFGAVDTPMLRAVSPEKAEAGMKPHDLATAVFRIVNQGPAGATGQSYFFGFSGTTREESLKQLAALEVIGG
ncbi:SDR family NAD(P)-dependent oxidoreductase [Sphingorhabdus sp. Alg231-15]|uniref:SDR family NAD(P)-dependent oxidoreductase n=1 Tax=Sphingorhabdus sp. Alg231-15 TaxID=1922222 RepID=UPI000D557629